MQDGPEAQIKSELNSEIQTLEKCYLTIKNYLSGTEYDAIQIVGPAPFPDCVKTQIELKKLLQICIESFFKPTLFA